MPIIKVLSENIYVEIEGKREEVLSDILKEYSLPMPCGGYHTCGKCKVEVQGEISPLTQEEETFLTKEEIENHIRLACFTKIMGDCQVGLLAHQVDHSQVVLKGEEVRIEHKGYAIAVDIGTTTIATYLCKDGEVINFLGEQNEQSKYGADVITRISVNKHEELQRIILVQLTRMFSQLIIKYIKAEEIKRIVITGNTIMLHFFMGYDPTSIATYPFEEIFIWCRETSHGTLYRL